MHVWRLKRSSFDRVVLGHPWVFSSDLDQSPKSVSPGDWVELRDALDRRLGFGFGHPNNLIAFRFVVRGPEDQPPSNVEAERELFASLLARAVRRRLRMGLRGYSARMVYSEADGLPGLIVDRYISRSGIHIWCLQVASAGLDRRLEVLLDAFVSMLKALAPEIGSELQDTAIVLGRDSSGRALEGLPKVERLLYRDVPKRALEEGWAWDRAPILLAPLLADLRPTWLQADLLHGQKTGFFLDQRGNVQAAAGLALSAASEMLRSDPLLFASRPFRILDLFSYVGQWSAQMSSALLQRGVPAEVVCVDASQSALDLAKLNNESAGAFVRTLRADIVEGLDELAGSADFDMVICDPPAFAKKRKDIDGALSAYGKVNRLALRRVRDQGLFVSCSCSGHVDEEEFRLVIAKAAATHRIQLKLLSRGGHSPDHLQMPGFPQGSYLKAWIAQVERT